MHDPCFHADIIGPAHATYPFYRYEPILMWNLLRHVRPGVLYLFGDRSPVSTPDLRKEKLTRTGTSIGGSGGWKINRVKEITIPDTGHQLPFENVSRVCKETAVWLEEEVARWSEDETRISEDWLDAIPEVRSSVSSGWKAHLDSCLSLTVVGPKAQSKL
ncbi:alpha/beta-hydrolase [Penicillium diatomitis]|uniref:Alpha/beta-hydrolase n=1 Tax=Penicillium diatomitis TaxID=2819901 RepID=A0A9W9XIA8_9EURO|nr:alpha/beta-hydrolase [Penicillium diatomitis]KAJ5493518.1 alpha/beta-hydrolase [Penicillium diatomitis]